MSRRPQIPVQMAGGRPLPGAARPWTPALSGSTIPRFGPPLPQLQTPQQYPINQEYCFNFVVPQTDRAHSLEEHIVFPGVAVPVTPEVKAVNDANASVPTIQATTSHTATRMPAMRREFLYGAVNVSERGSFAFEPTGRLTDWLASLSFDGSTNQVEKTKEPAASQMDVVDERGEEERAAETVGGSVETPAADNDTVRAQMGRKRSADHMTTAAPSTKRSRVSTTIRRRFSRVSEGTEATSRLPTAAMKTTATGVTPASCEILPRLSFFSLGRAPAVERKIQICLIGDCGAGKTAFLNRLTEGRFIEGLAPSTRPDFSEITLPRSDGPVKVTMVDFPGTIKTQPQTYLRTGFYDAAIICYNIENEDNLKSVASDVRISSSVRRDPKDREMCTISTDVRFGNFRFNLADQTTKWKPALDNSLAALGRPLFVLGFKKDLRPNHPTLGLNFLTQKEAATAADGRKVAKEIGAIGFAECSAKTGENIVPAFDGIVNFVVANLKDRQQRMSHGRRRDKAKEKVKDTTKCISKFMCGLGHKSKD